MGSRVTELPLAGLELSQRKPRESSQRMGRLVLWVALAILLPAPAILQPLDQAVMEEQEQMKELLTSMFIDNHREGRDLEEDVDEEEQGEARDMDDEDEDQSSLLDDEADTEEGLEVVASNDPQEIARFNNYMDAIVLNMNAKVAKKDKKDKKKRVERSADLEEEEEDDDEVDRMGEVEEDEEDKEAKKMARKEKKKKRKNKKNKKDKKERKEKKERKKDLSPE